MEENNSQGDCHIAPVLPKKMRLQEYGVGLFSQCPAKSGLKKALKAGKITVNGEKATTATFIQGGEEIQYHVEENSEKVFTDDFLVKVVFEDDFLAVVNKPAGILVSGNNRRTVARALPVVLKKSSQPDCTTPHPVHRLDFPTTGLLLTGKTYTTIRALNLLFEERKVKKTYLAIAIGAMNKHSGKINGELDGKMCSTDFEVVASVPSPKFEYLNLVRLHPETGRKHQLRKQLAAMGNPILGDADYGIEGLIIQRKGLYLHHYQMEFMHPQTDELCATVSPLPKKFKKIFPNIPGFEFQK